jgi:amino acid transporter
MASAGAPAPLAAAAAPQRDAIGLAGAFSIGIGGIVGGGIFATLGLAAAEAQGAAWIAFLVGGALALLTADSYVHLSNAFPSKGGTVTFVNEAFGRGVLAGGVSTMLVLSYVVILSLYGTAFAAYAATLLPADLGAALEKPLALAVIVALGILSLLSPRLTMRSEGLFNAGKLLILGLFVVVGLLGGGIVWSRLGPSTWPGPVPVLTAGMLVFLSYEGFELIANASDRVREPRRTLPLAFYGSVGTAILLYVLIVIVTVGSVPLPEISAARSHVLTTAAEAVAGPVGATVLAIGALLATMSAITSDYFGASKLPVMLAREAEAPELAEREVWGRHPIGLVTIMVLALACAAFFDLHALSATASAGFIAVFGVVNAANAHIAGRTGSRRAIPVVGVVACGIALIVLLVEMLRSKDPVTEIVFVTALFTLPFAWQWLYRRMHGGTRQRSGSTSGRGVG